MLHKIKKIEDLKTGDLLYHVLGFSVSVLKVTESKRNRKGVMEINKMIKCRYQDKNNMLHVFEFYPDELRIAI